MNTGTYNPERYRVDPGDYPAIGTATLPGPESNAWHARCTKYFKGLSSQVKLFPVAFESGSGCTLRDVDGNRYIDFSSGIYVTTLGHCHPKVTEAVQKYAGQLINCHDFTTKIKTRLCEKLAEILPGDLTGYQCYDCGTELQGYIVTPEAAAAGGYEAASSLFEPDAGQRLVNVALGMIL